MMVFINDEQKEVECDDNLGSLLITLNIQQKAGWAVALNEKVILHDEADTTPLKEGDKVLLFQATQGG